MTRHIVKEQLLLKTAFPEIPAWRIWKEWKSSSAGEWCRQRDIKTNYMLHHKTQDQHTWDPTIFIWAEMSDSDWSIFKKLYLND